MKESKANANFIDLLSYHTRIYSHSHTHIILINRNLLDFSVLQFSRLALLDV